MELVLQHYQAMLDTLLPALCAVVRTMSESGDMRFFCLRMVSEATQQCLMDPGLYGTPATSTAERQVGLATDAIDNLMTSHVLPMVPQLLRDEDPMPLYGLKLLGGLLEVNPGYVRAVEALGLAPQFFDFLSLEHSNNNVHNIRLCRQIMAAGAMPIQDLVSMQVADKVAAVLEYATQNSVEPFLEPVLELCHAIVQRDAREVEAGRSDGALMAVLLEQSGVFLELCARPDAASSTAAAVCLLDMVNMYPQQCAPWLMAAESLAAVTAALQGDASAGSPAPVAPQVQQHLLEALQLALAVPGTVVTPSKDLSKLGEALRQLWWAQRAQ
ncbi:predicted protein [Haematococcus lacustris]|uniref:Importin N-terminal domain-containing protein n=1 Tax=Haematococcus lacustris TaxID=44745 RepID=A0A699ZEW6_HAELA|nr:predicted protein [Haematococcus lacustris]